MPFVMYKNGRNLLNPRGVSGFVPAQYEGDALSNAPDGTAEAPVETEDATDPVDQDAPQRPLIKTDWETWAKWAASGKPKLPDNGVYYIGVDPPQKIETAYGADAWSGREGRAYDLADALIKVGQRNSPTWGHVAANLMNTWTGYKMRGKADELADQLSQDRSDYMSEREFQRQMRNYQSDQVGHIEDALSGGTGKKKKKRKSWLSGD